MNNDLGVFAFISWSWLVEQLVVWAVLTVLVSFGVNRWRTFQEKRKIEEFSKWSLVLLGDDDPGEHQSLHWEEVKRIRSSDFERWKLVKSTVSGYAYLTVSKILPAEQSGWTYMDDTNRNLVVDFNKIPCEHLVNGQWTKAPKQLADDAKCPNAPESPSEKEVTS